MLLNISGNSSAGIVERFQFNMELQALYQAADLVLNQAKAARGQSHSVRLIPPLRLMPSTWINRYNKLAGVRIEL